MDSLEQDSSLVQGGGAKIEAAAVDAAAPVDISVVVPVYNEEERIVNTVTLLSAYLGERRGSYEIIISDDGSNDSSPNLVREKFADNARIRLMREPRNRGKGAAVRRGVLAARGELIIFY